MRKIRRIRQVGVTPQHVLYMAMKIPCMRVRGMVLCISTMKEERKYMERLIDRNLAFVKTFPNSIH